MGIVQGSEAPRLPSPPPSPPTAPPLELVCPAPASQADTFDQWRLRLRQDLENISNDDTDSEMGGRGDHEETEEVVPRECKKCILLLYFYRYGFVGSLLRKRRQSCFSS